MAKVVSGSSPLSGPKSIEKSSLGESLIDAEKPPVSDAARIIGQPEGPFGTAAVSKHTVLLRSLGNARFSKFESLELAPHGLFVVCNAPQQFPFQAKSTLLEVQIFLDEPSAHVSRARTEPRIIKAIGRVEEIRPSTDLPVPTPAGYVLRLLQVSPEDSRNLENYLRELLLNNAI